MALPPLPSQYQECYLSSNTVIPCLELISAAKLAGLHLTWSSCIKKSFSQKEKMLWQSFSKILKMFLISIKVF